MSTPPAAIDAQWRRLWTRYLLWSLLPIAAAGAVGLMTGRLLLALALVFAALLIIISLRLYFALSGPLAGLRLPSGAPTDVFGLITYLLDQRRSRRRTRRLLQILRRYRHTAAKLPDGALFLERRDGRIVWFNKTAKRWLGLQYPQSVGQRLHDAVPMPELHEWLRQGDPEQALPDQRSSTDSEQFLSFRLVAYSNDLWLVLIRDVSKLVRLEQTRRDFVANVSHELRTPLTVIHGYLDLLDPEPGSPEAPVIEEMRKQSLRMSQLVEDLLTLSRLESQETLAEEPLSMSAILSTLKREAEALSQGRHQVVVERSCEQDLMGSGKEIHSAFSNLVSNAVRYTPQGGRITIRWEKSTGGGAQLAVQDNGYGIPAAHIPRITERFYRVSNSRSRESGGTGLGLSIVKHVLNLHDGHLHVESEVGRGSTFACVFDARRLLPSTRSGHPTDAITH